MIASNLAEESTYYSRHLKQLEDKLHIHVDLRIITWNRAFDTIMDAFKNNAAPDIFSFGTTWVHTMCYLNYLAPLPGSFRVKPPLADWMMDCITYKGSQYAVPFLCEDYVLMAKQKVLDSVGIRPDELKDWDSFYRSCQKISDYFKLRGNNDHIPVAFPLRPEIGTLHRIVVWMYKAGWTFPLVQSEMERIYRSDLPIKALRYIFKLLRTSNSDFKALQTDTQSLIERFLYSENEFTFLVGNGSTYVCDLMNNQLNTEVTLYPLPSLVPDGKTFGGGSVLTVSSECRHQELAWKVVEYLSQEEVLMGVTAISGNVPPFDSLFWQKYATDPNIRILFDELKHSKAYPFHPLWHAIEQVSGDYMAHNLWKFLVDGNRNKEYDDIDDKTLERLDKRVIDLVKMMWEMQEDEDEREE